MACFFRVKIDREKYIKANSHNDFHSGSMFTKDASICESFINPSMPEVEGNNLPKYWYKTGKLSVGNDKPLSINEGMEISTKNIMESSRFLKSDVTIIPRNTTARMYGIKNM